MSFKKQILFFGSIIFLLFIGWFSLHEDLLSRNISSVSDIAESAIKKDQIAKEKFTEITQFNSENLKGLTVYPGVGYFTSIFLKYSNIEWVQKFLLQNFGLYVHKGKFPGLQISKIGNITNATYNCAYCHAGKAAGRFYIGLGNKYANIGRVSRGNHNAATLFQALEPISSQFLNEEEEETYKALQKASKRTIETHEKIDKNYNPVIGLINLHTNFLYFHKKNTDTNQPSDTADKNPTEDQADISIWGLIKVPFLWGYNEKSLAGHFASGSADASAWRWTILGIVVTDQAFKGYEEKMSSMVQRVKTLFKDFLPPKYPFELADTTTINRGQFVYELQCLRCHGGYDKTKENTPIYYPSAWVSLAEVGTDPVNARAAYNRKFSDGAKALDENKFPLHKDYEKRLRMGGGYIAPRLYGIWARFPYLHNASVPTLYHLLLPDTERPKKFSLIDIGEEYRFDKKNVGLMLGNAQSSFISVIDMDEEKRQYDVEKLGQSNQGHNYGTKLSEQDRKYLIEYLKTL